MKIQAILLLSILLFFVACDNSETNGADKAETASWIQPSEDDDKAVQTALISAKPGDTVRFGEGTFKFKGTVSLDGIDNVTLLGKGMDKTIFSFKDQTEGAEGVKVTANNFTIQDMAIVDPKGDGIKVQNADGVIFRRLRVEWTTKGDSTNGAYGLYPVSSKNILMEECMAIGASDAGVYVGQSENAIVRNNKVTENVAGIEIENTIYAECYGNEVYNNTAGILIFDLPGLPKKNGRFVRVYDNDIHDNNHPNFSSMGISVAMVPSGVGLLFMATQHIEAFGNVVKGNNSVGAAIFGLDQMGRTTTDTLYVKYPSAIYLHDNTFEREQTVPDTTREFGVKLYHLFGNKVPMIFYDGSQNPDLLVDGVVAVENRICLNNNIGADFYNLETQSTDLGVHQCEQERIQPVSITIKEGVVTGKPL